DSGGGHAPLRRMARDRPGRDVPVRSRVADRELGRERDAPARRVTAARAGGMAHRLAEWAGVHPDVCRRRAPVPLVRLAWRARRTSGEWLAGGGGRVAARID